MEEMPDNIREEILKNFDGFEPVYFATALVDQPRVRPLTVGHLDGRFWIFTGTNDEKMVQINSNPLMEFCRPIDGGENTGYVRAWGTIKIVTDMEKKKEMAGRCPYYDAYWKGMDDPNYALLELAIDGVEYMKPGEMLAKKYVW